MTMGSTTGISWTDATWNPWRGCEKVSPGCDNCYMFRDQTRYGKDPTVVVRAAPATFNAPLRWLPDAGSSCSRRVFTCSWSDFFHKDADPWREEAWDIVRRTPNLTYQILTKRPSRIRRHLPADWDDGYPNVWLGVSVESQAYRTRAEQLASIPARVHFVSAEPLLGPIEFAGWLSCIEWVIVGGESGRDARPMEYEWARDIQQQCRQWGSTFFFKQRSGPRPGLLDGVPNELLVQEFPDV